MHSSTIPTNPTPHSSQNIPSVSVTHPSHHIRNPSNSSNFLLQHSTTNSSSTTSPISANTVLLRNNVSNNHSNSSPNNDNHFTRNANNQPNPTQINQSSTSSVNKPEKQSTGYHHNVPAQPQTQEPLPGHSFLSAVSEVKNMETALLGLLAAFNSEELSAFGSGRTLETMEAIRSKLISVYRTPSSNNPNNNPHQSNPHHPPHQL